MLPANASFISMLCSLLTICFLAINGYSNQNQTILRYGTVEKEQSDFKIIDESVLYNAEQGTTKSSDYLKRAITEHKTTLIITPNAQAQQCFCEMVSLTRIIIKLYSKIRAEITSEGIETGDMPNVMFLFSISPDNLNCGDCNNCLQDIQDLANPACEDELPEGIVVFQQPDNAFQEGFNKLGISNNIPENNLSLYILEESNKINDCSGDWNYEELINIIIDYYAEYYELTDFEVKFIEALVTSLISEDERSHDVSTSGKS